MTIDLSCVNSRSSHVFSLLHLLLLYCIGPECDHYSLPEYITFVTRYYTGFPFGVLLTFRGTIAAVVGGEWAADMGSYAGGDVVTIRINRAGDVEFLVGGSIRYTATAGLSSR